MGAEVLFGVNIFPTRPFGTSSYVLDPGSVVFELLPSNWFDVDAPPHDATVLPWEAELGRSYELVVTTRGGLCRCRLGDRVRVEGILGQMPIISVQEQAAQSSGARIFH